MSRTKTPRQRWRQALATAAVPASLRPMKASLLSLAELVTSDGQLCVWREQMEAATGLPSRTLSRHLTHAVKSGWLTHEAQGGRNHRAVYRVATPDGSVGHSRRTEARLCRPPTHQQRPPVCRPLSGRVNKESASDSEPVAVDDQRGRRTTPDSSREEHEHDGTSQAGIYRDWLPGQLNQPSSLSRTDVA